MKAWIDRRAYVFFSNANPQRKGLIFKKTSKKVCACVVGFVGGQEMGSVDRHLQKEN